MLDLGALKLSIQVDSNKAKSELEDFNGKAEKTTSKFGGMKKGAAIAAAGIAATGAAAVAGAKKIYSMATSAAETTDRIDKMSKKLGISREAYQELDFICSQSGTSVDGLKRTFKTMGDTLQKCKDQTSETAEAFKSIGVETVDASGNLRDTEAVFYDTISALQKMEDGQEKNALASQLLGSKYQELSPLLSESSTSIEEMKKQAHDLGLVLDDEAIDAGVGLTDTIDQASRSFDSIKTQLGVAVMPIVQKAFDMILQHMPEIKAAMGKVIDFVKVIVKWITDNMPVIEKVIQGIIKVVKEIVKTVKPVVEAIIEFIGTIVTEAQEKGSFLNTIFKGIKVAFKTVMNAIKSIFKIFSAAFKGDWKGMWEGIKKLFTTLWNGYKKVFKIAFEAIGKLLSGIGGALKNAAIAVFTKLKDGLVEKWTDIKKWVGEKVTDFVDFFKDLPSNLKEKGKKILTSLLDGLKNAWGNIKKWISEKVEWISDKFSGFFDWITGNDEKEDGSHRNGLKEVPYDGYNAILHKGEMVLTAAEAKRYKQGTSTNNETVNNITVNNYSPKALDEATSAREYRKTQRKIALGF